MFVKVLTLLGALVALLWMLRPYLPAASRPRPRDREAPPPRVPHAHDLVQCTRCGIWLPAGEPCGCEERG